MMRPSFITPSFRYQRSAPRGAPTCISSWRSKMYLQGRPVSIVPRTAIGSCRESTLPPKPPPTVPPIRCSRFEGTRKSLAVVSREKKRAWVRSEERRVGKEERERGGQEQNIQHQRE